MVGGVSPFPSVSTVPPYPLPRGTQETRQGSRNTNPEPLHQLTFLLSCSLDKMSDSKRG